jgi:UDP-N-acetyl-D-glucosamine dehydrogenase
MEPARSVICVQGLGFVGFAMATAVASACDREGNPYFDVIGVDLPTAEGAAKVEAINRGELPLTTTDAELLAAFAKTRQTGNLRATIDPGAYERADVTVVDIHLDVLRHDAVPSVNFDGFRRAIRVLGERMRPGSLVMVETTVPPGTCERVVAPELAAALRRRGLPEDAILLAHSYERVMPGRDYFRSIVDFWRVYAGATPQAAEVCAAFLSKVIHVDRYPLTRLHSTTASETGKVLENSYRAVNIAFIEEWGRFAEAVGIDLFEVIDAVRMRPTHSNMRQPGFGVGGYCLTKDPLLAAIASRDLFCRSDISFPFSQQAVAVNDRMPLRTLEEVRRRLGGSLAGQKLLLLGVSYRQDVGDTRYSPSEIFVRAAEAEGAAVSCHDPLVTFWPELDREVTGPLPPAKDFDAVIFAVPHEEYRGIDLASWLDNSRPLLFDANNVLTAAQREAARLLECPIGSIGRGL